MKITALSVEVHRFGRFDSGRVQSVDVAVYDVWQQANSCDAGTMKKWRRAHRPESVWKVNRFSESF